MEFTDNDFAQANARGVATKAAFPAAVAVHYDQRIARVVITLASKLEIAFAPGDVPALAHATPDAADRTPAANSASRPRVAVLLR